MMEAITTLTPVTARAMPAPDLMAALAQPRARNTHNKGKRFPPDPPPVEDIVTVLGACIPLIPGRFGELSAMRLRAMIALLWRTGLRCSEMLALEERDLMRQDMALVVRHGKGDKRRISAMDEWGWRELGAWLDERAQLPAGPVFCVVRGASAGQALTDADVRRQFREIGHRAGLRRRFHPHGLRHAHAVELWREGIDVYTIQQQLGHVRLDVTAAYLRSVAPVELLDPIGRRRPPMMLIPTTTGNGRL